MYIPIDAFIEPYFTELDKVLDNYVYNGYQALMHYIQIPLGLLVVLAISIVGYRVWTNVGGEMRMSDFFAFFFKVSFIYIFAVNWGHFSQIIINFFNDVIINGVGATLLEANPIHVPGAHDVNMALQLQSTLMDKMVRLLFKAGGWHNLAPYAYGFITWVMSTIMIALILIEMTIGKFMMAVLFVLAPLIIPTVLFERTKNIFNNWIGNLVGFSLLLVMINALLGIMSTFVYWVLPISQTMHILPISGLAAGITPFLIITAVIIYTVTKVHSVAMHIGAGVSSGGTAAGMMMGLIGGLGTAKMLGALAVSPAAGPVGMMTTGAMAAGKFGMRAAKAVMGGSSGASDGAKAASRAASKMKSGK